MILGGMAWVSDVCKLWQVQNTDLDLSLDPDRPGQAAHNLPRLSGWMGAIWPVQTEH